MQVDTVVKVDARVDMLMKADMVSWKGRGTHKGSCEGLHIIKGKYKDVFMKGSMKASPVLKTHLMLHVLMRKTLMAKRDVCRRKCKN